MCTTHYLNWGLNFMSHIITYSLTMDWYKPKHEAAIGCLTINGCSSRYLPVSFHIRLWLPFVLFFPGLSHLSKKCIGVLRTFFPLFDLLDFSFVSLHPYNVSMFYIDDQRVHCVIDWGHTDVLKVILKW